MFCKIQNIQQIYMLSMHEQKNQSSRFLKLTNPRCVFENTDFYDTNSQNQAP